VGDCLGFDSRLSCSDLSVRSDYSRNWQSAVKFSDGISGESTELVSNFPER
jgi:hypothetical protein